MEGRQDREHHLRAGAAEGLEVRRQDRAHERRAARALRGDTGRRPGQLQAQLDALQAAGRSARPPQADKHPSASPSARGCPSTCRAWTPRIEPERHPLPDADAARPWCAWAKTSANGWTSFRPSSSCSATSEASGHAGAASCWCRSRRSRRSSTRAAHAGPESRTRWSATSWTTCRTTGWSRSTRARACTRRARRWRPGGGRRRQLMPLFEAHRGFVLGARCCTPTRPRWGCSTPARARPSQGLFWAYARGELDGTPGVVYDFCTGAGSKYPADFLRAWTGTLPATTIGATTPLCRLDGRNTAYCLAHYPERCFIWCNGPPGQVLRGGSQSRSPHKIRRFRGTARRQEGPPWASTPWYSPARCLPSSRTPASHRASSAGWS